MFSSPYRPRQDEMASCWLRQEQAGDQGSDFRDRRHQGARAGQAAIGAAGLVSFGFLSASRRSLVDNFARNARAAMHRVMWRCQPCQERASQWSRPKVVLGALETLLGGPAQAGGAGKFGQGGAFGSEDKVIGALVRLALAAAEEQPALEAGLAGPGQGNPRPVIKPHPFRAFAGGMGCPGTGRQRVGQSVLFKQIDDLEPPMIAGSYRYCPGVAPAHGAGAVVAIWSWPDRDLCAAAALRNWLGVLDPAGSQGCSVLSCRGVCQCVKRVEGEAAHAGERSGLDPDTAVIFEEGHVPDVVIALVSRPGEFHPRPLSERCGSLSTHTAPIKQTRPRFLSASVRTDAVASPPRFRGRVSRRRFSWTRN